MESKQFRVSYVIVIILLGMLVFGLGFTSFQRMTPIQVFQVYIDGEVIGVVSSKVEFENYINQQEEAIKKKYDVDKVYMPNGVMIKSVTTYNSKIDTNGDVYKKIAKKVGYVVCPYFEDETSQKCLPYYLKD